MSDHPDDNEPLVIYTVAQSSDEAEETPYWTLRRVIYLIVAIILIIALLATLVYPLLWQIANPPPPPPTPPLLSARLAGFMVAG